MLDLNNSLVLVTGAAQGIERGVSIEYYAKCGAHIILLDILGDKLRNTAADMRKAGYVVYPFECDVSSNDDVASLGAKIIKDIGVPDVIHNNAYWAPHSYIQDINIEVNHKAFDISVLGYLRVVKAILHGMIERKSGWIVNTSSPNGITPPAHSAQYGLPYNLCKAADTALSQSMAAGLKVHGIGVSVIFLGPTSTEGLNDIVGTAPKKLLDATQWFEGSAISFEEAAKIFVQGVREGKFMVTSLANFDKMLVEYAKNGLDPNANYFDMFGAQVSKSCSIRESLTRGPSVGGSENQA
jgi:NAD(P)-dependent dehydrogenase (short-subunit alcohol dehydrogenase family)